MSKIKKTLLDQNKSKSLSIKNSVYSLPLYIPDATLGVVRGLDSTDLTQIGIQGVVVNTYHLMSTPGSQVLKDMGGIKNFMNFKGLVVSDSGGWQVFSLIHRNKNKGKITDAGVVFSLGGKKGELFTPENSIQMQFEIGSDIIICLDDFTAPNTSPEKVLESVERTTHWAKRSRIEYDKQIVARGLTDITRPHIYAVIQGDRSEVLRQKSATELIEIGFDGYGYGGYMIDADGTLDKKMSRYIASLIPEDKVKFALGTGTPWDIAYLYSVGWDIFDCTLPTRDARHKRLYTFKAEPSSLQDLCDRNFYDYIYINKSKYATDESFLSALCDCPTCKNYSKAYLHHLFKIGDNSAMRLATIHNLRTYTKLIEYLENFGQLLE
ncbi:queuine tRNA-ribosyltransferase family protein [candidate division WWE3 bacterium]|nr:queuine tRNA-ribosyltransferase family protein [candidate division WWE3 bacterium]